MKYIYIVDNERQLGGDALWAMAFTDEVQAERVWKRVIAEHGDKKNIQIFMKKNRKVVKVFNKK